MRSTVISAKTVEECVNKALDKLQANRNEVNIEVINEAKQGFLGLFGAKDAVVRVSLKDDVKEKGTGDFVKNILNSDSNSVETEQKEDTKVIEDKKVVEEVEETKSTKDDKEEIVEKSVKPEKPVEAEEVKETEEAVKSEETEEEQEAESDVTIDRNDELFITSKNFLKQMIEDMGIDCDIESRTEGNMIKFNIMCSEESDIGIIIGKRGETLDSLQYIVNLVTNRNADTYIRVILDCNQYRSKRERSLQKLARRLADKAIQTGRDIKLEPMNPYERRIIHTYLQNDEKVNTFSQGNEPNRRVIIKRK
ncbi:MAG: RNA-binding cell elongation regulator Jag/EloR [Finegoldia magna]|uniref:RNA-binding cell elongation regulator Jag/EloR n=1 Tax=Finegoldia magna TaxID=1260 RepID=UPI00288ADA8D|nr:RNA-binding cell elongation regulator Jag/EloR [Finegoldia magna]MDU2897993.1 RNA-binding cell elongation regulator Jag/EloR [Finegoldia magna]MDU5369104.1 RNA-binding cell elongation regulator Jag/EloR [Finegoldia magna]MDU5443341.1 RNA-binding cell elongation regulator Jag/EloR [Finegoldia magna]